MNEKSNIIAVTFSSFTIAVLLVAGTSIGGGMLALPVLTSVTGFAPSLFIYFLCWIFMASTGLLFLEVSQWTHKEANILSMAHYTLGRFGKMATWFLYLFLFYSLNIAYTVEVGKIVVQATGIADWAGPILFILLFAPCFLLPTAAAGKINFVLMMGLILSYLGFVILGVNYVNPQLLRFADWSQAPKALPIAFTAFAYQGIIPTLVTYLQNDIQKARKAILIGSFIPLIAYSIWQCLIMGIIPIEGPHGLADALKNDINAVQPMKYATNEFYVFVTGQYFAFFALVTSFLGVSLGLRDFLLDSMKQGRACALLLVFLPPLCVAIIYPKIFLVMLGYAGGIGCALLLGLLPIVMVWRGRYHLDLKGLRLLPGGKWILAFLATFVIFEVVLELIKFIP